MNDPSGINQELTNLTKEIASLEQIVRDLEISEAERKPVTEALLESREQYRSLVDNINFGINLIDKDFKIVAANSVSGKQFNKPAGELVGKNCFMEFQKRQEVCQHCPRRAGPWLPVSLIR